MIIKTYQELLAHFGAKDGHALRNELAARTGRRTKLYLHGSDFREFYILPGPQQVPADFRAVSFTVSVETADGDQSDNFFELPLDEDNLSVGLVELEDPVKAEREGEEFAYLMGPGRAEREVTV